MKMKLNCPAASNICDVTARHSVEILLKKKRILIFILRTLNNTMRVLHEDFL